MFIFAHICTYSTLFYTLERVQTTVAHKQCKNYRQDCSRLARAGWCVRRVNAMKRYCAQACGLCNKITSTPTTTTIVRTKQCK